MLWLTWRQHRIDLAVMVSLGGASTLALVLLSLQAQSELAAVKEACLNPIQAGCEAASLNFDARFSTLFTFIEGGLLLMPILAGVFVAAPLLAREFEQGTARLVWTQGVTRRRWFASKLAVLVAVALMVGSALAVGGALLIGSGAGAFTSRWNSFDFEGPALVGYVLFAMALGIAAGAVIRRMVPAMAATLVVFGAVRLFVGVLVRPNYLPPMEADINSPASSSGDSWNLGVRAVDLAGHPVSQQVYLQLMQSAGSLPGTVGEYLRAHGVVALQIYQPEDRFWLFQGIEAGIFVLMAAGLIALAAWAIRRP